MLNKNIFWSKVILIKIIVGSIKFLVNKNLAKFGFLPKKMLVQKIIGYQKF